MALGTSKPTKFPNGVMGIVVDENGDPVTGNVTMTPQVKQTALTDSTTGTPGATLAAFPTLTDSPASADALRDDIVTNLLPVMRNHIASLNAQIDALTAKLVTAGVLTDA